jgi:argininosuccinate lyase
MHGLPLTYNKDMQEDKEHLFDTADTLALTLAAARGMLATISFNRERMAAAASDEMIAAVDVADLLVRGGLPFREAHGVVAELVRAAVDEGRTLSSFDADELAAIAPSLEREALVGLLAQGAWLESKISVGGTALARLREQLAAARGALAAG